MTWFHGRSWIGVFLFFLLVPQLSSCGNLPGTESESEVITISGSTKTSNGESPSLHAESVLARRMASMHWFTQKLALSIDRTNRPLARYYLEKVRQTGASIEQDLPEVGGYPVGDYLAAILEPELEGLEQQLGEKDNWTAIRKQYGRIIEACNNCHMGTGREYLKMTDEVPSSRFSQSFAPVQH